MRRLIIDHYRLKVNLNTADDDAAAATELGKEKDAWHVIENSQAAKVSSSSSSWLSFHLKHRRVYVPDIQKRRWWKGDQKDETFD